MHFIPQSLPNQEMNVVSDAANSLRGSLESLDGAAQILMEAVPPRWFNEGSAILVLNTRW